MGSISARTRITCGNATSAAAHPDSSEERDLTPARTGGKLEMIMWLRIAGVLAIVGIAISMSLRSELSSVAARAALAAVAGGLAGAAWVCAAKLRAAQQRREPS
jgi:hypothetical protein